MSSDLNSAARIMRGLSYGIALASCLSLSGCDDSKKVWSAETMSPDKRWIAVASTVQYAGPGTAGILTTVRLKPGTGVTSPIDILVFEQNAIGDLSLKMNWTDSGHLNVTYKKAQLDFQAIKCGGVLISTTQIEN